MARILYGNFDFEYELEDRSYQPSSHLAALTAGLVPHLIALAGDGDYLWNSTGIPPEFLIAAARAGLPEVHRSGSQSADSKLPADFPEPPLAEHWGWSAVSVRVAEKHRWKTVCPALASVAQINDRLFGFALETESECALPGSRLVRSIDELLNTIRVTATRFAVCAEELQWVAKSRFGMASRGRIRGTGTLLRQPSIGWLSRQFRKNGQIVFEPWVTCDREFSTQWVIPCPGEAPELLGWTEILNNADGAPCGWVMRPAVPFDKSEFRSALPVLTATVNRIQAAGYFGPVGIDSMRCLCPGTLPAAAVDTQDTHGPACLIRPLQDINGRYTMGRVALELAARLTPEQDASWLQLPAAGLCRAINVNSRQQATELYARQGLEISNLLRRIDGSEVSVPGGSSVWLTSPLWFDKAPATRCGVLMAGPERSSLTKVFQNLFA